MYHYFIILLNCVQTLPQRMYSSDFDDPLNFPFSATIWGP